MASRLPNDAVRLLLRNAADHGVDSRPFVQELADALRSHGQFDVAGLVLRAATGAARVFLWCAPAGATDLWDVPLESSPTLRGWESGRIHQLADGDPLGRALRSAGLRTVIMAPLGSGWVSAGLLCVAARDGSPLHLDTALLEHAALVVRAILEALQGPAALAVPRSLEQVDYFATMGRLAGGLVHEVNNPATFITLAAGQLDKTLSRASNADELQPSIALVRDIVESTRQMRAVVSDFHVLSTVARHAVSGSLDLTRMLRAGIALTTVAYRTQTRVDVDIGDLPACPASFASVVPVVMNLLINSIQSIPEGKDGACTIECKVTGAEDRIDICIRDTGSGIGPDDLPRVFDPFFSTRGSAGLGLTLARDAVLRLGGEMHLESALGEGTAIEISLPVPQEGT